ncbi:MAG: DUF2961 domain-containing protein [Clostridiales bacterium]|nr:DUF2961 domain-containing protein [Clostridiales bacterium]
MFSLDDLKSSLPFKAKRKSSYDISGGNGDSFGIAANSASDIFNVNAIGEIRHIWMAIMTDDPFYLRKILIRMYWDGEETPSVEAPVGDFFGVGHARSYNHTSICFSTTVNDTSRQGEGVALNCWIPMPFGKSARIELVNEQDTGISVYYYVDWREFNEAPKELFTFHASWKRQNPIANIDGGNDPLYLDMLNGKNLTDKYNFLMLYAEGKGNYLGINLYVDNIHGEWWGEGDDMIFIDRPDCTKECGGSWPPDLHGTGSEDYLCHAWGMQRYQHLYCGESWCEDNNFLRAHNCNGKVSVYRFHVADAIPFEKNIRVSMEHGHANDRNDDWACCTYWYQTEPHSPLSFEKMLPVEQRMPRPPKTYRRLATYMN